MWIVLPIVIHSISTIQGAAASCSDGLVNVVFNKHYKPSQFSQMPGASNWITFGLGNNTGQIPMMGGKAAVDRAISMVNGPNPPDYMLTFNEPDHSYSGHTPTMSPQEAADAIAPLLASPGKSTKYIAPVPAKQMSDWLPQFYKACNCRDFFTAHNVHIYRPTVKEAKDEINAFRKLYNDKPLWITEIAPGNATPPCQVPWNKSKEFMQEIYAWGQATEWIQKIFWNSGNEINATDHNVCNSYLLDFNDKPSPLLAPFNHLTCS